MTWRAEPGSQAGFTLIELLIVIAIMGLMVMLVVMRGPLVSRNLTARQAAQEVAEALREARSEAIGSGRSVALTVNRRTHAIAIGTAGPRTLAGTFDIEVRTVMGEIRNADIADIRFLPDGSATGGRIVIDEGGRKYWVGIDWLNGRVTQGDAAS